jgi:hypothetical protein
MRTRVRTSNESILRMGCGLMRTRVKWWILYRFRFKGLGFSLCEPSGFEISTKQGQKSN